MSELGLRKGGYQEVNYRGEKEIECNLVQRGQYRALQESLPLRED